MAMVAGAKNKKAKAQVNIKKQRSAVQKSMSV